MKCGKCGKVVQKHDCTDAQECLELTSLDLIKMKKDLSKMKKDMEQFKDIETNLKLLKETYKDAVVYTNAWLSLGLAHGYIQSDDEIETLDDFSRALKGLVKNKK